MSQGNQQCVPVPKKELFSILFFSKYNHEEWQVYQSERIYKILQFIDLKNMVHGPLQFPETSKRSVRPKLLLTMALKYFFFFFAVLMLAQMVKQRH